MGPARRGGCGDGGRHARPGAARGRRDDGGARGQRLAAAAAHRAAARAGRRRRHRCQPDRADGPASGQQRFRAELLSVHRVRPRRLPVAVHAGARRRGCAAAAVAVPDHRAQAGRRDAREHARFAARNAVDRRACESRFGAAGPPGELGVGACAGGRARQRRRRGRCGARRPAATIVVAAVMPAPAGAEHRLHRVRRAGLRARPQERVGAAGDRRRSRRRERAFARVVTGAEPAGAGAVAAAASLGIPHRRRWRFRIARAQVEATAGARGAWPAASRHQHAGVRPAGYVSRKDDARPRWCARADQSRRQPCTGVAGRRAGAVPGRARGDRQHSGAERDHRPASRSDSRADAVRALVRSARDRQRRAAPPGWTSSTSILARVLSLRSARASCRNIRKR